MHSPYRCPVLVTGAVIGVVTLIAYYFWSKKKKKTFSPLSDSKETITTLSPSVVSTSSSIASDRRVDGGKELEDIFSIEDEHVRNVCQKLFSEQMDLGESLLQDEKTAEQGAMHMANAITLTGETTKMLKVLFKTIPPANYACIQKYLPTAELRVNQLLQDELAADTISAHFG